MSLYSRAVGIAALGIERVVSAVSRSGERISRAGRPGTNHLKQLQSWQTTIWKVDAIKDALERHERGDFSASAKLSLGFARDERITACRNTRIRALVGRNGSKLQIVASEVGDQRSTGKYQKLVAERFYKVCTEAVLSRIQRDAIDMSVAICRITWSFDRELNEWLPALIPWDLEWVHWDDAKGCYVTQTTTGEVEIRPNTGEWLIIEPAGPKGWAAGSVLALGLLFFFRGATWADWARYCEKHGVPILAIREPPVASDQSKKATKDKFYEGLRRLGREGLLRLPQQADGKGGYSAEYLEPKTLSYPSFLKFLERIDICIAVYLLGQNLSTEVSGGSFAAAIAQNRIRLDYLSADAEALSTALHDQLWVWWGRFNFDAWDDTLCPWAVWDAAVPEDLKAKADMLAALGNGLQPLISAGMKIDIRRLAEQYNVPVLSEQDALKQAEDEAARKKKEAENAPKKDDSKDDESDGDARAARHARLELVEHRSDIRPDAFPWVSTKAYWPPITPMRSAVPSPLKRAA